MSGGTCTKEVDHHRDKTTPIYCNQCRDEEHLNKHFNCLKTRLWNERENQHNFSPQRLQDMRCTDLLTQLKKQISHQVEIRFHKYFINSCDPLWMHYTTREHVCRKYLALSCSLGSTCNYIHTTQDSMKLKEGLEQVPHISEENREERNDLIYTILVRKIKQKQSEVAAAGGDSGGAAAAASSAASKEDYPPLGSVRTVEVSSSNEKHSQSIVRTGRVGSRQIRKSIYICEYIKRLFEEEPIPFEEIIQNLILLKKKLDGSKQSNQSKQKRGGGEKRGRGDKGGGGGGQPHSPVCYKCGESGHIRRNCPSDDVTSAAALPDGQEEEDEWTTIKRTKKGNHVDSRERGPARASKVNKDRRHSMGRFRKGVKLGVASRGDREKCIDFLHGRCTRGDRCIYEH